MDINKLLELAEAQADNPKQSARSLAMTMKKLVRAFKEELDKLPDEPEVPNNQFYLHADKALPNYLIKGDSLTLIINRDGYCRMVIDKLDDWTDFVDGQTHRVYHLTL